MRRIAFLILLVIISCSKNEVVDTTTPDDNTTAPPAPSIEAECVNGFAAGFPCNDYDLVARLTLRELDFTGSTTSLSANDSWGWTDPADNKEYALVGLNSGTAFVDMSTPEAPIVIGFLPTATVNSDWRDVKVYDNYAFVVSEASNHGMQIFDLTKLRNVSNPPVVFSPDATYTGFGNAHNIVINETTGFAYAVGTSTFSGGPHFIDIRNPLAPRAAGGYAQDTYSHDAQVVTYNGPDTRYTGKEILIGSNEDKVAIVDVTDKSNPVQISTINYSNIGYTHQGWFTDDMRYFLLGDEVDEIRFGGNTRTIVFDFSDLENPVLHTTYDGPTAAIDHNGYVNGDFFYLANYTAGVRIIDISDIGRQTLTEVGFFDTHPSKDSASFNGVWNVYPYFSSGNIVVSDIEQGLFIVRKSQ